MRACRKPGWLLPAPAAKITIISIAAMHNPPPRRLPSRAHAPQQTASLFDRVVGAGEPVALCAASGIRTTVEGQDNHPAGHSDPTPPVWFYELLRCTLRFARRRASWSRDRTKKPETGGAGDFDQAAASAQHPSASCAGPEIWLNRRWLNATRTSRSGPRASCAYFDFGIEVNSTTIARRAVSAI